MFNLQGSEIVFLLLIALVVLGPEKLPDAIRKFSKGYAEFKKAATGFQTEFRNAVDEPLRELRSTADAVREAATFDIGANPSPAAAPAPRAAAESVPSPANELDFGLARRKPLPGEADGDDAEAGAADAPDEAVPE